jgi:hypothetical protein
VGLQIIGPMPSATCWDREFADSPVGEGGFELTVPLATDPCGAANLDRSFSSIGTLMSLARESVSAVTAGSAPQFRRRQFFPGVLGRAERCFRREALAPAAFHA